MGNVPSSQDETMPCNGPQRLTKPRTNTNSAGVSRKDSDSYKSTPSKSPSRDDRNTDPVESPFSFSHESPLNVPAADNAYYGESPSSSAPNLTSRSSSLKVSNTTANRHSFAGDGSDLDIGAAIALLQQLKKNASPEDLIALHKALLPTRSVDPEVTDSLMETQEPEEAISPLIRRSSLLPAGLATRISLEAIKRRPSRMASQEKKRRSTSQFSSRQKSGTWEQFVEGGFDSLDPADKKRLIRAGVGAGAGADAGADAGAGAGAGAVAPTPADFELTHIGGYQLGSLRITNGAASPEPAFILNRVEAAGNMRNSFGSATGEGFVTADEGEGVDPPPRARATRQRSQDTRSAAELRPKALSFESRPVPKSRSTVGLKVDTGRDGFNGAASPSQPQLCRRASDIAHDYIAECPTSPYAEGAALSNHVSRLSTVEDNSPVDETRGGPEDALKMLTGAATPSRSRQVSTASDSSASRVDQDERTYLQEPRRPSIQAKTDSGYSSETSWQAQAKAHVKGAKVDDVLKAATWTDQPATFASARSSFDHNATAVAITAAEARPLTQAQRAERHRSMPVYSHPPANDSNVTIATSVASSVARTEGKVAKVPKQYKKLQKTRSHQQQPQKLPPAAVTASQEIEAKCETVPGVPDNVSVNFSRRLTQRPGMAHLDQTFASVDETAHKDEAQDEDETRGRGRKQEAKSGADSPKTEKKQGFFGRLRSRSRSKSQHRSSRPVSMVPTEDEPMPSISDFGTVAQSLGGSPYDIATRHVKTRQSYDGSRPQFHPHEITSELSQRNICMDDETAAEYARSKSRDIAEQQADDGRARSQSRSRRHVADCATPTSKTPVGSRPNRKRSVSAHAPSVPTVPEHREMPERPKMYRVGTIKFEGGEAQGRLSPTPIMMERPKTKRRTQSVSPRIRVPLPETAEKPEEREIPEMPKLTSPTTTATTASNASTVSTTPTKNGSAKDVSPTSSARNSAHPGWPGWETQARLWRERKQSLGQALTPASEKRKSLTGEIVTPTSDKRKSFGEKHASSPTTLTPHQYSPTKQAPRHSPAIVISRYVTPTSAEIEAHIGNVKTEDPYAAYHTTNPTDHLPAKDDVDRTDSAVSSSSYNTAVSNHSIQSAASRNSAAYRAYRPADAGNMSKPTSPQSQHPRDRFPVNPRRSNTAPAPAPVPGPEFDRYSGGLGYGWERGVGFGGSAGTRHANKDQMAKRRSVQLSESFGVDLSDVPVFMTRG